MSGTKRSNDKNATKNSGKNDTKDTETSTDKGASDQVVKTEEVTTAVAETPAVNTVIVPVKDPLPAAQPAPVVTETDVDSVMVVVPKGFRLNTGYNKPVVAFAPGTQRMSREHFDHPYVKANGVKLHEASAAAASRETEGYDYAAKEIVAQRMTLEYAVGGMSQFFKIERTVVEREVNERVAKLKAAAKA